MTTAEEEAMRSTDAAAGSRRRLTDGQGVPLVGLAVGVWAMLPPYVGPRLATDAKVEVVDHVVPGVVVLAIAVTAMVIGRQTPRGAISLLVAGFTATLAGIWMIATHLPLVAQAMRHEVAWVPVAHHTLPGLAVAALGLVWTARHWQQPTV